MKQLTPWSLHGYQVQAIKHGLEHPQLSLWLDMGLGKSVIALTITKERMDRFQLYGTLIVAPKRVCQTVWKQEAVKWSHTNQLTFSTILGTPEQRTRAAMVKADVYLVSYENLVWLVDLLVEKFLSRGLYPPFNSIIFDEITKLKDAGTKRHGAIRKLLAYLPYRMGLTGTPASNGYLDLFGQYLALDSGDRLGTGITQFKHTYFDQGYNAYELTLKPGAKAAVQSRIADITLQMSSAEYLTLPTVTYNDIWVTMPARAFKKYQQLEEEFFIEMDSGVDIEVANAAGLTNKCLQAANGALYDETGEWSPLHTAKLEALDSIMEEAAGQPVLVLFNYHHDRERILERFPMAEFFGGGMDPVDVVDRWSAGKIKMLIGHPGSMGHGLNLQYGGHTIVWFGLNWSLDLYLQTNARIDRQGQTHPVIIHRILTADTMDVGVLQALAGKAATQQELRAALQAYRRRA